MSGVHVGHGEFHTEEISSVSGRATNKHTSELLRPWTLLCQGTM